jgi:O-antigen/teichoic acid export membrane protein
MELPDRALLKRRVLNASLWTFVGFGIGTTIRFGSNLLMTRLLFPEMFGVMAIANVVMIGLGVLSDIGLQQNVVYSQRGHDPAFLNTIWVAQIMRGGVLSLIGLAIALLVVLFDWTGLVPKDSTYANPSLPYVIAIISSVALLQGLQSTKVLEANRKLLLGRLTAIELVGQSFSLICMLTWAYIDRSIWALVAGYISSRIVSVALSYIWLPGVSNRWQWDQAAFREIITFGRWIFISSIIGFVVNNGDRLLLGGLISSSVLGVYMIAYTIYATIEQVLVRIITDVSFPALSEIVKERPGDLKSRYYRVRIVLGSIAYGCSGALIMSGHTLISLLYDSRYEQAGWMLQCLAVALLTTPSHIATQCFVALGEVRLLSSLGLVRLVILLLFVPAGFHFFGLVGAIWGIVLSQFSWVPMAFYYKIKYRIFDLQKELLLLPVVLAGLAVGKLFNEVVWMLKG